MKILYGVQSTGNGHISRSRALAQQFKKYPEVEVQWLFSGRPKESLFEMSPFGNYWWREGMTFTHSRGRLNTFATLKNISVGKFIRDIRALPVHDFDLVISDYEPVTAWAAKLRKKRSIGIGHQYAFEHPIPTPRNKWASRAILKSFAPTQESIGLHWHHFGHPILPPIVLHKPVYPQVQGEHILVYLPFEQPIPMLDELAKLPHAFIVYGIPHNLPTADNIQVKAPSIDGFQRDLVSSKAVICNSGFELLAETLALGKPILSRPLTNQFEQEANAKALTQLKMATVVKQINARSIAQWLAHCPPPRRIVWPDVADSLGKWIAAGCKQSPAELSSQLWREVAPKSVIEGAAATQQTSK
ncbi:MJ1255/VC2487 family glycosyltransferase [Microbulbifer sp. ZKSA006]|uniref:MJ1255/VC2487 family glycosyltransferase n=1 Tax=Microbulbifer sp. ZKSA006 TaxID=3243390 RepID=UPI0040394DB4